MLNLLKNMFGKKEVEIITSFDELAVGEEFERMEDTQRYVKISPTSYCQSVPVNSHTSLKWRLVTENFAVSRVQE